jgi:hypothetical protein
MPSFTLKQVIEYINRIRKEAYFISADHYNVLCQQQTYMNCPDSNLSYQWYVYPVIPYMQSMSSTQIIQNKDLFYFVFNVFMSQNKPPYEQLEDEEHIYCIAKEQYDQL